MLYGSYQTLRQTDLKALLAYSTVSQLGLLTALYGAGYPFAATTHLINHAAFKAALFLVVGIIDHETGSRDVRELSGLARKLPLTFAVALPAALSMAGLPPFGGFIFQRAFLRGDAPRRNAADCAGGAGQRDDGRLQPQVSGRVRGTVPLPPAPGFTKRPWGMLVPPALLTLLVVLFGVFPWGRGAGDADSRARGPGARFRGQSALPLARVYRGADPVVLDVGAGGGAGRAARPVRGEFKRRCRRRRPPGTPTRSITRWSGASSGSPAPLRTIPKTLPSRRSYGCSGHRSRS